MGRKKIEVNEGAVVISDLHNKYYKDEENRKIAQQERQHCCAIKLE
jgi:hypothetical protein